MITADWFWSRSDHADPFDEVSQAARLPNFPLPSPNTVDTKDDRYYFASTSDQYLYQSKANPREGMRLLGQFGLSDGNPNKLDWSVLYRASRPISQT